MGGAQGNGRHQGSLQRRGVSAASNSAQVKIKKSGVTLLFSKINVERFFNYCISKCGEEVK